MRTSSRIKTALYALALLVISTGAFAACPTGWTGFGTCGAAGTAALVNTGTSGGTLGLLNASKTDSGNNTFSGTNNFTGTFEIGGTALKLGTLTNTDFCSYSTSTGLNCNIGSTGSGSVVLGTAPSIAGGALSGTFSGNPTFSGVPIFSGLSSGTCANGLALDSGNHFIETSCGSGSSAFSALTSGTNTGAAMVVGPGASLAYEPGTLTVTGTTFPAKTAIYNDATMAGVPTSSTGYFTGSNGYAQPFNLVQCNDGVINQTGQTPAISPTCFLVVHNAGTNETNVAAPIAAQIVENVTGINLNTANQNVLPLGVTMQIQGSAGGTSGCPANPADCVGNAYGLGIQTWCVTGCNDWGSLFGLESDIAVQTTATQPYWKAGALFSLLNNDGLHGYAIDTALWFTNTIDAYPTNSCAPPCGALAGSLTTNAQTPTSSNVLNFASVPSWVTPGMPVVDQTNTAAINGAQYVESTTGTTVTLYCAGAACNVNATVNSGDVIAFGSGGYDALLTISGNGKSSSFTGGTGAQELNAYNGGIINSDPEQLSYAFNLSGDTFSSYIEKLGANWEVTNNGNLVFGPPGGASVLDYNGAEALIYSNATGRTVTWFQDGGGGDYPELENGTSGASITTNAGSLNIQPSGNLIFGGITGATQCLHASAAGVVSGTGSDCGAGTPVFFVGATTNSSNAYSIASPTPSGFTFTNQYVVRATISATNTGAATLAVNGTTAEAIEMNTASGWSALKGGELISGLEYDFTVNTTCTCYVVINTPISAVVAGTTQTVTAAQWASYTVFVVTSASQTLTLPVSSSLSPNGGILIQTIGQSVTLAPNSGDAINGGSTGASATIASGLTALVTTNGSGAINASPTSVGTGTVTSVTCGAGLSGGTITMSGTCAVSPTLSTGTSHSFSAPMDIFECSSTCTVTPPTPAAGYEFCARNEDNVTTVITFAAISGVQYENTNFTSYKSANTSIVSGGAAGDKLCVIGRDSTHYDVFSYNGTWS